MAKTSPHPNAYIARIQAPAEGKLSGRLVPRHMGYLAVKVTFHLQSCAGLKVQFSTAKDDGSPGEPIGEAITTGADGVARLDYLVPAGVYACEIQYQPATLVSTVSDALRPFIVITPVGRPYIDIDEALEFEDDGESGPDEDAGQDHDEWPEDE